MHDKTIQILTNILNDAKASKRVTHDLMRKGYKIKEITHPQAFIIRRLKHIK